MKHRILLFLSSLGCIISLFLQACSTEAPKKEPIKSNWDEVINEKAHPHKPASPPTIDSTLLDTTPPVQKVEKPSLKAPFIKFESPTYKFDTIKAGDIVNHEFKFTNSGERPLEITKVNASCGCTTPSWPFLPFSKGETGSIKARFDSRGKSGKQETTITVNSNAENGEVKLKIIGFVKTAE